MLCHTSTQSSLLRVELFILSLVVKGTISNHLSYADIKFYSGVLEFRHTVLIEKNGIVQIVLYLTHPPVRAQIPLFLGNIIKRQGLLPKLKLRFNFYFPAPALTCKA
jgi:hypothetical protein